MSSSPFKIRFEQATDIGRVRQKNDDFTLSRPDIGLFIVCDGVGGNRGGDVASRIAAETTARVISEKFVQNPCLTVPQAEMLMAHAIREASAEVFRKGNADRALAGMCTTLVAIWIVGNHAILGHVGDSRIYQLRGGRFFQLTEDHTYEQQLIREGRSPEEARKHMYSAHVNRIVGDRPVVEADTLAIELMPHDRLYLCTDGITKMIPGEDLAKLVSREGDLKALLRETIDSANRNGGRDNSSAILIELASDQPLTALPSAELKIDTLKEISFFKSLTYAEINKILSITDYVEKKPGEVLMTEGEESFDYWVLLSGKVDIFHSTKAGSQAKVSVRGTGMGFGESALFKNGRRKATVIANTPVKALVMNRQKFFDLARKDPSLGFRVVLPIAAALFAKVDSLSAELAEERSESDHESKRAA